MTQIGEWLQNNPEQFAIIADMVGSGLWSKEQGNPFAGVGSFMAQSSLAEKARQARAAEQDQWRKMLVDLISGRSSGADVAGVPAMDSFKPFDMVSDFSTMGLTPKGMNGGDSLSVSTNPDGSLTQTYKSTGNSQTPRQTPGINAQDIFATPNF